MDTFYSHQMDVVKNIVNMDKADILEELIEMNVDLDEIHDVSDIFELSNMILCRMLDHIFSDYDYLKCKFEFDDDDLCVSSNCKIEIIQLVTRAILNDICANGLCM